MNTTTLTDTEESYCTICGALIREEPHNKLIFKIGQLIQTCLEHTRKVVIYILNDEDNSFGKRWQEYHYKGDERSAKAMLEEIDFAVECKNTLNKI